MSEKLTPSAWQTLAPQQFTPEDRLRLQRNLDEAYARGFRPNALEPFFALAEVRAARDLEQLQRRATELMAALMQSYSRALDDAAMLLLARGCRNLARVLQPGGVDELWVDAPADRTRVGEVLPGRCVYRQWMQTDEEKMSIEREWLDPVFAEAAGQAVRT